MLGEGGAALVPPFLNCPDDTLWADASSHLPGARPGGTISARRPGDFRFGSAPFVLLRSVELLRGDTSPKDDIVPQAVMPSVVAAGAVSEVPL